MLSKEVMEGIAHELSFWKVFVTTDTFIKGWVDSTSKTPDLHDDIHDYFLNLKDSSNLKVLDIGSGAVSILNGTFNPHQITSVDPLGALYEIVFDYSMYGIQPPISQGGELIDFTKEFDIVHASNSIDHSQNPYLAFQKMIRACKPNGLIVLQTFENEATFENNQGLHQYDLSSDKKGRIFCKDARGRTKVFGKSLIPILTSITPNRHQGRTWIIQVWRKPRSRALEWIQYIKYRLGI